MKKMTDTKRIAFLQYMLSHSLKWAVRTILRIYENQTTDERYSGMTIHENGIGFNSYDVGKMTKYVRIHQRNEKKEEPLPLEKLYTQYEIADIFRRAPKYAAQLLKTKVRVDELDGIIRECERKKEEQLAQGSEAE